MIQVYTPTEPKPTDAECAGKTRIFLGGSIEMGVARDWQSELIDTLSAKPYADKCMLFNPRRADWDSSWPMRTDDGPFREQVLWELENQEKADLIVYYFCAETVSPITLLELGLFHKKKPIVFVEPGFGRLGNVVITCERYGIEYYHKWNDFIAEVDKRAEETPVSV